MTPNPVLSILMVLILTAAGLLGLACLQRRLSLPPEWSRKLLHVGSGLTALGLPGWFQNAVPVLALCAASLTGLLALKRIPAWRRAAGSVIGGVGRRSHGELYFVAATGLLFLFSGGDFLLYSVPMVILTFADSAAALVGQRYGRHRFQSAGGAKSLEGSAAFFITAAACAYAGLSLLADTDPAATLLLALLLALLLTLVEALAGRGCDNLLIPLAGYLLLRMFLGCPTSGLLLYFIATAAACAMTVRMHRRPWRCPEPLHGGTEVHHG